MNQPDHQPAATPGRSGHIPLPQRIKLQIKAAIVAITTAVWVFIRPWSHLMESKDRYFNKIPATSAEFLAQVVDILAVAILIWLGIALWRRSKSRLMVFLLDTCFFGILLFPLDYFRVDHGLLNVGGFVGLVKHPLIMALCVLVLLIVIWNHRAIARVVATLIGITCPAALWFLWRMALLACNVVQLPVCAAQSPAPALLPTPEGKPRVLWIIFDETDYRLTFEKRPPGVALPEFDKLRTESFFADHALPPGNSTIISMPALITGRMLSDVGHDDCDLLLTEAGTGQKTDWSATPSVFSKAREMGFNTALIGWYHPYRRVLGSSLNYCAWYPYPGFEMGRGSNFIDSLELKFVALTGRMAVRRRFINTCRQSLDHALEVVTNRAYGLILLHLPPPHLPGVYLPAKDDFTMLGIDPPAGYFNNLQLADHQLGALRKEMEKTGQWDKTWVILSADHSWRMSEIYDGKHDFRVPYLVKSPGQKETILYSHPFNTVLTRDLIIGILGGEINSPAGVTSLLNRGKAQMPVLRMGEGTE